MSARVNLLPPELAQRARAARARNLTIAGVTGWTLLLALLYVLKLGDVNAVENERDAARGDVQALQAQVDALEPYAELDRNLAARNDLLAATMGTEISWARLLNDLSLSFPPNSSLVALSATVREDIAPDQAEAEQSDTAIADAQFEGYSVEEFSPGVEAVLLRLVEVRGLFNAYLAEASDQERAETTVTGFNGSAELNEDAFTRRYVDGLPPEVSD